MQPQGQTGLSTTVFGCLGDELLTVLQVLFFLVLGYVIARAWLSVRSRGLKVSVKTVDDFNTAPQDEVDVVCEDMVVETPRSSTKARNSNAQERKRTRKASQPESKNVVKMSVEMPPCHSPVVVQAAVVENVVVVQAANQPTSKVMMKKAERKSRKAQQQKEADEEVKHVIEVAIPSDNTEKSDSDDQTVLSSTASTPSMVSGASTTSMVSHSEKSESEHGQDSVTEEAGAPSNEPVEAKENSTFFPDKECDISEVPYHADESEAAQESALPSGDEVPGPIAPINFDDIESDTDSDGDLADNSATMLDASQSFSEKSAPIMWCNPGNVDTSQGWVAVAVQAECAPPGAFDGLWKNGADEKILIEKLDIMFESGVSWDMEMHSHACISVQLDGQQFHAELDGSGQQLLWSDGDVWTFFGRAQTDSAPDAVQGLPMQEVPMFPMPEEMQMFPMPEEMQMFEEVPMFPMSEEMLPPIQCIPANAEKWEVCWDWAKKGGCPRGMNCEWYHPAPEPTFW